MLRSLLHLLLCLCVVANAASGAWAAVGMAMPQKPTATVAMPCHQDAATADGTHAKPMAQHEHASDRHQFGCKSSHCDCLQHCNATQALSSLPQTNLSSADALNWTLHASHGDPSPYRPVRPPIG